MSQHSTDSVSPTHTIDSAIAYHSSGNRLLAEQAYYSILAAEPSFSDAHHLLGVLRLQAGRLGEARTLIRKAIVLQPEAPPYYSNLGEIERSSGNLDEAGRLLRRALTLHPGYADAHHNLGLVLLHAGSETEGVMQLNEAIRLNPRPVYFYSLANATRLPPDSAYVNDLETRLRLAQSLRPEDRVFLRFALAKAYRAAGRSDDALVELLEGNALRRSMIDYDEGAVVELFDRIEDVFSTSFLAQRSRTAPVDGPIFIVGMPRSGTSLVEQILASHHDVFGAGELDLVDRLVGERSRRGGYPAFAERAQDSDWLELGTAYRAAIAAIAPDARRVTDKMPTNFLYCGTIHLALPQARIIHIHRDPVDTCLSCFSTIFAGSHTYSCSLEELGRFYRRYSRLMDHWRRVLPADLLLDVSYEALVTNPERETRRMLCHCALEWDEACLRPYETKRPVVTASKTQVRQPIYTTSIGGWRPDPGLLKPLTEALFG